MRTKRISKDMHVDTVAKMYPHRGQVNCRVTVDALERSLVCLPSPRRFNCWSRVDMQSHCLQSPWRARRTFACMGALIFVQHYVPAYFCFASGVPHDTAWVVRACALVTIHAYKRPSHYQRTHYTFALRKQVVVRGHVECIALLFSGHATSNATVKSLHTLTQLDTNKNAIRMEDPFAIIFLAAKVTIIPKTFSH